MHQATSKIRLARRASIAKRDKVLDGAIEVLASQGARGLTHRSIDKFLKLPLGTTSNYFGNRSDLVTAVAEKVLSADLERIKQALQYEDNESITSRWVAERFAPLFFGRSQSWNLVRFETFLEARRRPALGRLRQKQAKMVQAFWDDVFRRLGACDLRKSATPWVDICRGLLMGQVIFPERRLSKEELISLLHDQLTFLLKRQ